MIDSKSSRCRRILRDVATVALAFLLSWAGHQWLRAQTRQQLINQQYKLAPPGMVLVPAGVFIMGSDDPAADPDERPARRVFLPAFYMDRFEVTNRRYKEFKKDHQFPPGEDDLPVTHVLKSEAEAYCRWAGKRLPTSAEWEKAARGTDGRVYPWGSAFVPGHANVRQPSRGWETNSAALADGSGPHRKMPGGTFAAGASPYGCQDMSGNVWEWVSDNWRDKTLWGFREIAGLQRGIIRGGGYCYSPFQARASYQGFEGLETTCNDVGFRCAMDAVPKRRR